MESWKNIIPFGLVVPFLIIIVIEYGIILALNSYNQKLNEDILTLEIRLKEREENIVGVLESNIGFKTFSQAVNVVEILKNRKSLNFVINKFNQLMPQFLIIKEFNYDADEQKIEILAATQSWEEFLSFYKYLSNLQAFEIKELVPPKLDQNNLVSFSMVLLLKPSFYQQ